MKDNFKTTTNLSGASVEDLYQIQVKAALPPVAGSEVVARALALEYYRGQSRERYSNPVMLKNYAGPAADFPETAALWIEEQAQLQARQFWTHWHAESVNLLNS